MAARVAQVGDPAPGRLAPRAALRSPRDVEPSLAELSSPVLVELHDALSELDRARAASFAELSARIQAQRERLLELCTQNPTPAELAAETQALPSRLAALAGTLEHPPEVPSRGPWLAFRARVQPAYEAVVHDLRDSDVDVPSLRPTNYLRNALHLASCVAGVLALELSPSNAIPLGIALAFAVSGWTLEFARTRSEAVNTFCMQLFGRTAHPHEARGINSATWYATALVPIAWVGHVPAGVVALLVLGLADPAAAIVGRRFGRRKLVHGRTLEGTVAFVAVGTLAPLAFLALLHPSLGLGRAAIAAGSGAVCGAIAELVSKRLDDNLTIPLAAFGAAWLTLV